MRSGNPIYTPPHLEVSLSLFTLKKKMVFKKRRGKQLIYLLYGLGKPPLRDVSDYLLTDDKDLTVKPS